MTAETLWVAETRPCKDPECDGTSEPEGDPAIRYWACTTCGYEFGYERVGQAADGCSLGIPEDTRRRAMAPPESRVFLGTIGRRP
jgi:hypothetical protein